MKKLNLLILIFLSGCFFGVYQRPKTLGEGNMDFTMGVSLQFTTNPYDRREIESKGYGLLPNIGIDFSYGVLDNIDIGFRIFSGAGIGPFARFAIFKQKINKVENELLVAPFVLYDPFISNSMAFKLDAIYSWQINKYFEPFIFYQVYYHPYFEKFMEAQLGVKPLGNVNGFYQFFGVASGFNIYLVKAKTKKKRVEPDLRFNLESGLILTYLEQSKRLIPVFNLGLSFGGRGLFSCYKERENGKIYEFCPGGVFFRIIGAIFGAGLN